MSDAIAVKQVHDERLHKISTVVGTGIGEKHVHGKTSGKEAILVFVEQKLPESDVIGKYSATELIPTEIDGIPVDVIEVGKIMKQTGFSSRVRPLKPGYSCGHGNITAGTIGGFFKDSDGDIVILSNCHVLADEGKAKVGDPIFQPGPIDSAGHPKFNGWPDPVAGLPYCATLKKFVPIHLKGNTQDSSIATINEKVIRDGLVDYLYPTVNRKIAGWGNASVNQQVQKCGRTTGYTTGRVMALHASFSIGYDFGTARFDDCVVLSNMSAGGDSGSIIADMSMNAVALLFAGSSKVTIANPISIVRQQYGLQLVDNKTPDKKVQFCGRAWDLFTVTGETNITDKTFGMRCHGHHVCYLELDIDDFQSISCVVNSGDDYGATWGPGLAVEWPDGMLKVNLRCGRTEQYTYGGYYNSQERLGLGRVTRNKNYILRIRRTKNTIIGEVCEDNNWCQVIEVPASVFHGPVNVVRVGKTGKWGGAGDFQEPGEIGSCSFRDFAIA